MEFRHPGRIPERIRDRAERRNIGDEKISCPDVGQPHDQSSDTIRRVDYALRAVIIKEIVATAPEDVQGVGIGGVAGQIIAYLSTHVVDGDGEIATAEGRRVINDSARLRAVLGRGAAKCIIGPAIETVFCDW